MSSSCSICGTALPAGLPEELCPVCSLRGALGRGTADHPAEARRVGDYDLLEECGRGGMGVVHRARHTDTARIVALKMIAAGEFASLEAKRRFLREAEAAGGLDHPRIVRIHEVGEHEGQPFMVLDFLDGGTLADAHRLPMPPDEAARLMAEIARAIHFAHERGVLHRDLKPSNILLDAAGHPHITDFGLARRIGGEAASALTLSGQVLGSPAYMPPEQAGGKSSLFGPPSDVYSLGAILYCLLTGRAPFEGESVHAILAQTQQADPVPPGRLRSGVPAALEAICLRCMEKDPRDRYASAKMLADDLDRFLSGVRVRARRRGPLSRGWRWCRRHRGLSILAAALAITMAAALTGAIIWHQRERRAAAAGGESEWEELMKSLRAQRDSTALGRRNAGLEIVKRAAAIRTNPELRDEAIRLLALTDWAGDTTPLTLPDDAAAVTFNPENTNVIYTTGDRIVFRHLKDGRVVATLDEKASRPASEGPPAVLECCADGITIAAQSPNGLLRVWNVQKRIPGKEIDAVTIDPMPRFTWQSHATTVNGFAPVFSRDGHSVRLRAIPCQDFPKGGLVLVSLKDGSAKVQMDDQPPSAFFTTRPGTTMISVADGQNVTLHDIADGASAPIEIPMRARVTAMAWQENGQRLAVGTAGGHLALYSQFDSFTHPRSVPSPASAVVHLQLGPAPDFIVLCVTADGATRFVRAAAGGTILAEARGASAVQYSRDYSSAAYVSGQRTAGRWRMRRSDVQSDVHGVVGRAFEGWSVDISADGEFLLMESAERFIIRDLATGDNISTKKWLGDPHGAWFTPGGKSVLTTDESGVQIYSLSAHADAAGMPNNSSPGAGAGPILPNPFARPRRAGFSADGTRLMLETTDSRYVVRSWPFLWPSRELPGRHAAPVKGPAGTPRGSGTMALSPDGRWAAAGFPATGGSVIWDLSASSIVHEFPESGTVLFSPDGRWFLHGGGEAFRLCASGTWREHWSLPRNLPSPNPGAAAFSPDGRMVALDRDNVGLLVIDTESGSLIATLTPQQLQAATSVRFHPATGEIFAGTPSNTVLIWNLSALTAELAALGVSLDISLPEAAPDPK